MTANEMLRGNLPDFNPQTHMVEEGRRELHKLFSDLHMQAVTWTDTRTHTHTHTYKISE